MLGPSHIVDNIMWWYALCPLCTLVHELGHAWAALRHGQGDVSVQVGPARGAWLCRIGRLSVSLSWLGPGGLCRSQTTGSTRRQSLQLVLAGPAASLLLACVCALAAHVASGLPGTILGDASLIAAFQCIGNLIPRRSRLSVNRGMPSDGLLALRLLQDQPLFEPAARLAAPPAAPHTTRVRYSSRPAGFVVLAGGALFALLAVEHRIAGQKAMLVFLAVGAIALLVDRLVVVAVQIHNAALLGGEEAARPGSRLGHVAPAQGARSPLPDAAPARPAMKLCPSCGERVTATAKLCYCYHAFG